MANKSRNVPTSRPRRSNRKPVTDGPSLRPCPLFTPIRRQTCLLSSRLETQPGASGARQYPPPKLSMSSSRSSGANPDDVLSLSPEPSRAFRPPGPVVQLPQLSRLPAAHSHLGAGGFRTSSRASSGAPSGRAAAPGLVGGAGSARLGGGPAGETGPGPAALATDAAVDDAGDTRSGISRGVSCGRGGRVGLAGAGAAGACRGMASPGRDERAGAEPSAARLVPGAAGGADTGERRPVGGTGMA